MNNRNDLAKSLLANLADANAGDDDGYTPLHWAVSKDNRAFAELLLMPASMRILVFARQCCRRHYFALLGTVCGTIILAFFYFEILPPLIGKPYRKTHAPILVAGLFCGFLIFDVVFVVKGCMDVLANSANVNAQANNGTTPLHWAADRGDKDMVELMLVNKADVNSRSANGGTPLHSAAAHGRTTVVELLLANHADVNARNKSGLTPLHVASTAGYKDLAEMLRQHGGRE
jgi:ankyrin repeat protein